MSINPLFLLLFIISVWMGIGTETALVFSVAILHEGGHLLMGKLMGCKIHKVSLAPWGVCMQSDGFQSAKQEFFTALAGPLVNVLLLLFCFFWKSKTFIVANVFMLVVNLLPVLPLDGGRMVRAFLHKELEKQCVHKIMSVLSVCMSVFLFFAGVWLFYKTKINFSLLIVSIFIAFSTDNIKYKTFCNTNELCFARHYLVYEDLSAQILLKLHKPKQGLFLDVMNRNGCYLGTLSAYEVLEEIATSGYEIKFGEILQKHLQNRIRYSIIDSV